MLVHMLVDLTQPHKLPVRLGTVLKKATHEAFGGVVHVAELEPLLVGERLCQGLAQGVGVQRRLVAVLQLRENHLQITNTSLQIVKPHIT